MENRKMHAGQGNNTNRQGQESTNQKSGRDENGRFIPGSSEASNAGKLGGQRSQGNRSGSNSQ